DSEEKGFEIGEVNRKDLSMKSLFVHWEPELDARGFTHVDILGLLPVPGGTGLVTSARMGDDPALVFFSRTGIDHLIKPRLPGKGYRLGKLAWSPDHKTIYT